MAALHTLWRYLISDFLSCLLTSSHVWWAHLLFPDDFSTSLIWYHSQTSARYFQLSARNGYQEIPLTQQTAFFKVELMHTICICCVPIPCTTEIKTKLILQGPNGPDTTYICSLQTEITAGLTSHSSLLQKDAARPDRGDNITSLPGLPVHKRNKSIRLRRLHFKVPAK